MDEIEERCNRFCNGGMWRGHCRREDHRLRSEQHDERGAKERRVIFVHINRKKGDEKADDHRVQTRFCGEKTDCQTAGEGQEMEKAMRFIDINPTRKKACFLTHARRFAVGL